MMQSLLVFNLLFGYLFPIWDWRVYPVDFHDIHVSKCEIQWNDGASTLEVATQIFLDDLQKILTKQGAGELFLCTEKEAKEADTFLKQYLAKRLEIAADGQALSPVFIGKEPSEDQLAVWCYIELKVPANFSRLKVRYDVLMDLYDDQKNIVSLKIKGKNGFLLFNSHHTEETINY